MTWVDNEQLHKSLLNWKPELEWCSREHWGIHCTVFLLHSTFYDSWRLLFIGLLVIPDCFIKPAFIINAPHTLEHFIWEKSKQPFFYSFLTPSRLSGFHSNRMCWFRASLIQARKHDGVFLVRVILGRRQLMSLWIEGKLSSCVCFLALHPRGFSWQGTGTSLTCCSSLRYTRARCEQSSSHTSVPPQAAWRPSSPPR